MDLSTYASAHEWTYVGALIVGLVLIGIVIGVMWASITVEDIAQHSRRYTYGRMHWASALAH